VSAVTIRDATDDDLPATLAIYNQLVADTTVTWALEPETLDERRAWVQARRARGFPALVAEDEASGEIVGMATYADFRDSISKPGYRFSAELSIHVHGDRTGQGIGPLLLDALIDHARRRGIHVMVAGVDGDNHGSIRFFTRHGFTETARMREVGHKFGRWLDVVFLQRVLD
jgi:phosphinothricin acetyltransferase